MDTPRRRRIAWILAVAVTVAGGAPAGHGGVSPQFGPALRQALRAATQLIRAPAPPAPPARAEPSATTGVRA